MVEIIDLCSPVTLRFGDVVEFPFRRTADSTEIVWGKKSVITGVEQDGRTFSAADILELNGQEALPLSGTIRPPCRKIGETWDLDRVATAVQRGLGGLSVARVREIYTPASLKDPVEYMMRPITDGPVGEPLIGQITEIFIDIP